MIAFVRRHRFLVAVAVLVFVTMGTRCWWGWRLGRQLAAERDAFRQQGRPVDLADYPIAQVPDAKNGWLDVVQAGAVNAAISPSNTPVEYPPYPPFGAAWEKAAALSETSNASVFRTLRGARDKPLAQLRQSAAALPFAGYNTSRSVANTLGDGAMYRHLQGDDVEAIERLLDLNHLADMVYQDDALISHLVGIGLDAMGLWRVQMIAPGMKLDASPARKVAEQLLAALLDEHSISQDFKRSFEFERLFNAASCETASAQALIMRPLATQEILWQSARARIGAQAAGQSNAADAMRILESDDVTGTRNQAAALKRPALGYWRWFSSSDLDVARMFEQHFRCLGERRATVVSLAAQLYRTDHGTWPTRIEDLSPTYLPTTPADPFHDDGRALGYVVLKEAFPGGPPRPLVYFDAGPVSEGAIDIEPMYGFQYDPLERQPRVEVRQYRDISAWSPPTRRYDVRVAQEAAEAAELQTLQDATRRSADAVEHDPQQPDAPRNDAKPQKNPAN